jgi:sortase B
VKGQFPRRLRAALKRLLVQALVLVALVFIGLAVFKFAAEWRERQIAAPPTKPTVATTVSPSATEGETVPFVSPVDFDTQQREAPDVIAWLTIDAPKVKIDYPVVQGGDNQYYLKRTPTKQQSKYGSVFMDFRCHSDFSDFFTVLYAHHIQASPDRMFAPLVRFKQKDVFDAVQTGMLYTPEHTYELQIFACAVMEAEDDIYIHLAVFSPAEKEERLAKLKERSKHWREIPIGNSDHIVMLSTCSYDEGKKYKAERTVVLAKLVEIDA